MKRSALIAFPVLIILFLFGPGIFSFVFGEKWRDAGEYARILSPWFFLDFIRASVSQVVFITGHQRKLLLFSVISNVFLVVAMLYGGLIAKDIKEGFIIFSTLQSLVSIYLLYWFSVISGQNKNQIFEA